MKYLHKMRRRIGLWLITPEIDELGQAWNDKCEDLRSEDIDYWLHKLYGLNELYRKLKS